MGDADGVAEGEGDEACAAAVAVIQHVLASTHNNRTLFITHHRIADVSCNAVAVTRNMVSL